MLRHRRISARELTALGKSFATAVQRCESLWGEQAFRRPDGDGWRDQTLAGMYDAQMLAVAGLSKAKYLLAAARGPNIISKTRRLFNDAEFDQAVRAGTNTPARIKYRVGKMLEVISS